MSSPLPTSTVYLFEITENASPFKRSAPLRDRVRDRDREKPTTDPHRVGLGEAGWGTYQSQQHRNERDLELDSE